MSTATAKIEYQLRRTAGILGIIQALTWSILSIICIALYLKPTYLPSVDSYIDQIGVLIYAFFLAREGGGNPYFSQILAPSIFFIFIWVHLVLNIVWLVASARILGKNTSGIILTNRIKLWAEATFVICLLDLITVIILGVDYGKCLNSSYAIEEYCANGILSVLVIAAKGFVLWIINVIFAQFLYNRFRLMRVEQMYLARNMTSPIMVQPQFVAQGYPNSPTTNWNPAQSPYPQYQHQTSYQRH